MISNLLKYYFKSSRFAVLQGQYFKGYFALHMISQDFYCDKYECLSHRVLPCSDTQLPSSVLQSSWVVWVLSCSFS